MKEFLEELKRHRHFIPRQTIKTIKGQALKGDLEAARKGLKTAVNKDDPMTLAHRKTKTKAKHHVIIYPEELRKHLRESHKLKRGD